MDNTNKKNDKFNFKEEIKVISESILNSKHFIIFTGAGISTESGISDFRGPNGVWTRRDKGLPPLPSKVPFNQVKPNCGHEAIVNLQNLGYLKFLISQNTDSLHLKSGIKPDLVAELHGNYRYLKCLSCDNRYTKEEISWNNQLYGQGYRTYSPHPNQPPCLNCGGRLISSVVNFEDPMPQKEMDLSTEHISKCDVILSAGSSLKVTPAADFPKIVKNNGGKLYIINIGETGLDHLADIKIEAKTGTILPSIVNLLKQKSNVR